MCILKSLKKGVGSGAGVRSGSVSQRYGSADPDQNVTDPQTLAMPCSCNIFLNFERLIFWSKKNRNPFTFRYSGFCCRLELPDLLAGAMASGGAPAAAAL